MELGDLAVIAPLRTTSTDGGGGGGGAGANAAAAVAATAAAPQQQLLSPRAARPLSEEPWVQALGGSIVFDSHGADPSATLYEEVSADHLVGESVCDEKG